MFTTSASGLILLLLGTAPPTASSQTSGLEIEANSLFLDRTLPDQSVITQMLPVFGETAVQFTDSAGFDAQAGIELAIRKGWSPGTTGELIYFGLHNWSESSSVQDNGQSLFVPFSFGGAFLDDFEDSFIQGFTYGTEIHNAEANIRCELTPTVAILGGFRYFQVLEAFHLFSVDEPGAGSDVGLYHVDTSNHLLGLQIGGDLLMPLTDRVEIVGTLKTAAFANIANHDTLLVNDNAPFASGGAATTGLSALVDANLLIRYAVHKLQFQAGYRVLMVSGLAVAPDQLDFSINEDPAAVIGDIDHQGTIVFHGPWAGVVGRF